MYSCSFISFTYIFTLETFMFLHNKLSDRLLFKHRAYLHKVFMFFVLDIIENFIYFFMNRILLNRYFVTYCFQFNQIINNWLRSFIILLVYNSLFYCLYLFFHLNDNIFLFSIYLFVVMLNIFYECINIIVKNIKLGTIFFIYVHILSNFNGLFRYLIYLFFNIFIALSVYCLDINL